MNINYKKTLAVGLSLLMFLPLVVSAASFIPAVCTGSDPSKCDFTAFATFINTVITWFLNMSAVVAAITFSIAGANMLLHPESPEEIKKAKSMFTKTIIGMIIVLVAWLVVHTVVATLVNSSTNALRFLSN